MIAFYATLGLRNWSLRCGWTGELLVSFNTHGCYQTGPYGTAEIGREVVRLEVPRTFQQGSVKGWAISVFSCVAFRSAKGMYPNGR